MDSFCNRDVAQAVAYEFKMFEYLSSILPKRLEEAQSNAPGGLVMAGTGTSTEEARELSALMESFLLHTRVIRDFLHYYEVKPNLVPPKKSGPDEDDVIAEDFVPTWGSRNQQQGAYLKSQKKRLDKSLAHLSRRRVEFIGADKNWDIEKLYQELWPVVERFLSQVKPEQQGWFVRDSD